MKLGFITKENPKDRLAYSGTNYSMFKALKQEFDQVVPLGPLDHWYKYPAKLKGRIKTSRTSKIYKYQYNLNLAKKHASILDQRILEEKPDVLLGSLVTPEVAFLQSEIPLYLTTDATFPLLQDLYKSHSNLHPESIKNALILERTAFEKAQKLLLPLKWLRVSAMNHYRIPENKIEVIPYGGNIEGLDKTKIERTIGERRKSEELTFLFVGVRWEEKGGPEAVSIINELNKKGVKAKLVVVGCNPNIDKKYVEIMGFLNKENPNDLEKLTSLYKKSAFFLLPTKAECIGMSFIEAASFGLPGIGTEVGGIPEAVTDGESGIVIKDSETPERIAERILQMWKRESDYKRVSINAFEKYQATMNWESWGTSVKSILQKDLNC